MTHVVLLGDSIFDNARYVTEGRSVIEHVQHDLPTGWKATLLAIDGALASDVEQQLRGLPADASHLFVSAGGNNALDYSSLVLHKAASSFAEVLERMAIIRADFQREYQAMLYALTEFKLPVTVCTVYDAVPGLSKAEHSGLCLFNEVILREAFRMRAGVIDLRLICCEAADYSSLSPIEPSNYGGGKIARAIVKAATQGNEGRQVIA